MPQTVIHAPCTGSLPVVVAAAVLVAMTAACGGGADDGSTLNIHFATGQLTARYFHGQTWRTNTDTAPVSVLATGTVDPVPQGNLAVRVVLDAPVFGTDVGLQIRPPNSFALTLWPRTDLPAGEYTGTITVQAFRDAAMTQPYRVNGGTVPYTLTVDPQLTVSVKIDGVLQAEGFSSSHHAVVDVNPRGDGTIYWHAISRPAATWTLHPGQLIELEASVPVTWYGPRTAGSYGSWFAEPVATATTFKQVMPDPALHQSSGLSGNAFVAMPLDGRGQYGAGFVFDLRP